MTGRQWRRRATTQEDKARLSFLFFLFSREKRLNSKCIINLLLAASPSSGEPPPPHTHTFPSSPAAAPSVAAYFRAPSICFCSSSSSRCIRDAATAKCYQVSALVLTEWPDGFLITAHRAKRSSTFYFCNGCSGQICNLSRGDVSLFVIFRRYLIKLRVSGFNFCQLKLNAANFKQSIFGNFP